jgi:DNA-binding NarL/FixJ family response regulator
MDNHSHSKNILVVENSKLFRKILIESLQNECPGTGVIEATTVREALQMMKTADISLYLLDIQLPDGSGLDLILRIKRVDPHTPVVVLSTYDSEEFQQVAFQYGATQFYSKRDFHIHDIARMCAC